MRPCAPRALVRVIAAAGAAVGLWLSWPALDRAPDLRGVGDGAPLRPDDVALGRYLATLGNCAGCHTPAEGPAYSGGRMIPTPFGGVVAANLTPDAGTGLGRWSRSAFGRALREGRSGDGRPLLPVCPYPNFALLGDDEADALWAYLRSLAPQQRPRPDHALLWPYGMTQSLLAWRALSHRRAELPPPPPAARADWARGAWLVGGPGHCSACHGRRNGWGATAGAFDLRGGQMPAQGWFAPSLADPRQAAVSGWTEADVLALLRDGRNRHATVSGPMARVVAHSTQHWLESDLRAAAEFLRHLPPPAETPGDAAAEPAQASLRRGESLYDEHCADCHGREGQGAGDDGPPLAGNRAVAMASPINVVRTVLRGGFGPATRADPQPAGMPPFATVLADEDLAAVVSWVRWRFGGHASPVSALDVNRQR